MLLFTLGGEDMKRFFLLEVSLLILACGLFAAGAVAEPALPAPVSAPVLALPPSPVLPLPVPFTSPLSTPTSTQELRIKYLQYDEQGIAILEVTVDGGEIKTVGLLEGRPVRIQIWNADGEVIKDIYFLLLEDGNIYYKEKKEDEWTSLA